MTLKEIREACGLSQIKLDQLAGIRQGNTHDLEVGRNTDPSWTTVEGIIGVLRKRPLKNLKAEDIFANLPQRETR